MFLLQSRNHEKLCSILSLISSNTINSNILENSRFYVQFTKTFHFGLYFVHHLSFALLQTRGFQLNWNNKLSQIYELADKCMQTNYYGVKRMIETFALFQLSKSPRVVNVSFFMERLKVLTLHLLSFSELFCLVLVLIFQEFFRNMTKQLHFSENNAIQFSVKFSVIRISFIMLGLYMLRPVQMINSEVKI